MTIAHAVRYIHIKWPDLTNKEIANILGCQPTSVVQALRVLRNRPPMTEATRVALGPLAGVPQRAREVPEWLTDDTSLEDVRYMLELLRTARERDLLDTRERARVARERDRQAERETHAQLRVLAVKLRTSPEEALAFLVAQAAGAPIEHMHALLAAWRAAKS